MRAPLSSSPSRLGLGFQHWLLYTFTISSSVIVFGAGLIKRWSWPLKGVSRLVCPSRSSRLLWQCKQGEGLCRLCQAAVERGGYSACSWLGSSLAAWVLEVLWCLFLFFCFCFMVVIGFRLPRIVGLKHYLNLDRPSSFWFRLDLAFGVLGWVDME